MSKKHIDFFGFWKAIALLFFNFIVFVFVIIFLLFMNKDPKNESKGSE
jgi:hypothetical protein